MFGVLYNESLSIAKFVYLIKIDLIPLKKVHSKHVHSYKNKVDPNIITCTDRIILKYVKCICIKLTTSSKRLLINKEQTRRIILFANTRIPANIHIHIYIYMNLIN